MPKTPKNVFKRSSIPSAVTNRNSTKRDWFARRTVARGVVQICKTKPTELGFFSSGVSGQGQTAVSALNSHNNNLTQSKNKLRRKIILIIHIIVNDNRFNAIYNIKSATAVDIKQYSDRTAYVMQYVIMIRTRWLYYIRCLLRSQTLFTVVAEMLNISPAPGMRQYLVERGHAKPDQRETVQTTFERPKINS